MDITLLKENEDGSAVYTFEMQPEHIDAFVRLGIIQALKNGIKEAEELDPEYGGGDESI